MAFSLFSLSKSLPFPSLPSPSSTTLQLPKKASTFAPLVSSQHHKSTSTFLSSSLTTPDEITAVTCPSLAYANTLFFQSGIYNVQVVVADNEPEEKLLGRFRRAVFRAGVIQECKRRKFFETSQEKRKRKHREAAKKNRKRRPQSRFIAQAKEETPKKKDDEEDDNWELPEGDLPY